MQPKNIFKRIHINTPVVFTTAYDQHALEAFKVNSIDYYLLKPIKTADLQRALNKFRTFAQNGRYAYLENLNNLPLIHRYKSRLLVPEKDHLLPIAVNDIAYIYSTNKKTEIFLKDSKHYAINKSLDQLMELLNPSKFIRANKQYILSREAIDNLTIWFDNRLLINLTIASPEPTFISKNNVARFKDWLTGD